MDYRLQTFLKDKVTHEKNFTHTSMGPGSKKYIIDSNYLNEFYKIYCDVLEENGSISLLEKPGKAIPLIVDVDIKSKTYKPRLYTSDHIKQIVNFYYQVIDEIAQEPTKRMYYCCVLEKDSSTKEGLITKDGFHLHFPYFITEDWVQREYIRDRVLDLCCQQNIFKDIDLAEPINKVIDKNVPNMWLLYGSVKDPTKKSSKRWHVKKFYAREDNEPVTVSIKSIFKHMKNNTDYSSTEDIVKNLPIYLSIRRESPLTAIKDFVKPRICKIKENIHSNRSYDMILSDLIIADNLLPLLSDERADAYADWWEIGCILYNIGEGSPKSLELWKNFSQRSEKYEENVCEKFWNKMEMRGYTIGSLKHFAGIDSPKEYEMIKDLQVSAELEGGLNHAHNDIAKILHLMYEDRFVCADIEKDLWFEFRGHRWVRCQKAISLRKCISKDLVLKYSKMASDVHAKMNSGLEEKEIDYLSSRCGLITTLMNKLKLNHFKNSVMKEAVEYFYDEHFIERMDENEALLVFENGVYDARTYKFRDGRPDDYCTKTTGIYYKIFDNDDPRVKEILSIFKRTFPNPNIFKFFEQTVSDLILGGNRHKIFCIWNGDGDNGKSIIAEMLDKAFGDYYYSPPTTLLTGKQQQSSGPTPELIPCKGARVVQISETDNADILNCGTMKKLTGGDAFPARGLIKDPIKIVPHFKLILHCNKMPNVSADDKASWNRIRVLPFESRFVNKDEVPETEEECWEKKIFPKDKTLKDRIPELTEVFMWWLIERYEFYEDSDLFMPPEIKNATDHYHKNNDHYMQFIDDRLIKTGKDEDVVNMSVIHSMFKEWYKDSYPGKMSPNRPQLKDSLEKRIGKSVKDAWIGWMVKVED
jgi:P4 family phage/plasmid primase-like protien